jgi:hypothetical protein
MKRNIFAHQTPRNVRDVVSNFGPILGPPTATTSGPRPAPTTKASVVATAQSWGSNQQKCALDQQKWIEMGVQPAKTFKFKQQKIGFEE